MRFYESWWKLWYSMIYFQSNHLLSFCFVQLRWMYYWHFIISYCDERNFSVCYHTNLPSGNIGKYFAIVKRKVIFPISQILNFYGLCFRVLIKVKTFKMFVSISSFVQYRYPTIVPSWPLELFGRRRWHPVQNRLRMVRLTTYKYQSIIAWTHLRNLLKK